jgi:hypothetical protein
MTETRQPSIAEQMANPRLIEAAIQRAVRDAVLMHARAGRSVPAMRHGKVVWIPPEEILALPPLDEPTEV